MSLSQDVKKLEDENARLKKAVRGNCVLRNREGFEKPMDVDSLMLWGGRNLAYEVPPMRHIKFWERREDLRDSVCAFNDRRALNTCIREVTYLNRGETDEFGRVILEEVP